MLYVVKLSMDSLFFEPLQYMLVRFECGSVLSIVSAISNCGVSPIDTIAWYKDNGRKWCKHICRVPVLAAVSRTDASPPT